MSVREGVLCVVNSGKETECEWKIQNYRFLRRHTLYLSPEFKFEEESWFLGLFIHRSYEGIDITLFRSSLGSPIQVEFSVSVKSTEWCKKFERRERKCFQGKDSYIIRSWTCIGRLTSRWREFLPSGCLTIILTMKKSNAGESETASGVPACSCCKRSIHGARISFHKECLEQEIKCPRCDEYVRPQNWLELKCNITNLKAAGRTGGSFITYGQYLLILVLFLLFNLLLSCYPERTLQ